MADNIGDEVIERGNAGSALPPIGPSQSDLSPHEPDPTDTTSILSGAQLLGKAAWSAGRMMTNEELFTAYEIARRKQEERDAEELRELEHLAVWNRQTTVVGGIAMTNEEAQDARHRVIEHDDIYADWAVQKGYIREDEKDQFKRWARRKTELEEKRGRGTITAEEEHDEAEGDASRAGKAMDAATAQDHTTWRLSAAPVGTAPVTGAAVRDDTSSPLDDYASLQASRDEVRRDGAAAPVSTKIAATGLDL